MSNDKASKNTSSGGNDGTTAADAAAVAADQPYEPIGKVIVLAEKKVGNFITRVKQDAKRVWKEVEEIAAKVAGK